MQAVLQFGDEGELGRAGPAAEILGEPGANDLARGPGADDPRAHGEDLRVIAEAGPPRGVHVMSERGVDAGDLVGDDAHAEAGPTGEDRAVVASARDGPGNPLRD